MQFLASSGLSFVSENCKNQSKRTKLKARNELLGFVVAMIIEVTKCSFFCP